MPLLHQYLLDKVGYGWTLRILALYIAAAAVSLLMYSRYFSLKQCPWQGIAAFFVNPRIPISSTMQVARQPMQSLRKAFLSIGFLGCFLTTLMQGFGYLCVILDRFNNNTDRYNGSQQCQFVPAALHRHSRRHLGRWSPLCLQL